MITEIAAMPLGEAAERMRHLVAVAPLSQEGRMAATVLAALDEAVENEGVIRVLRRHRDEAEAAIERVRKLHRPDEHGCCVECTPPFGEWPVRGVEYPCLTVRTLDGEG